MPPEKLNRLLYLVAGFLVLFIIAGSIYIILKRDRGQPLEIIDQTPSSFGGQIFIAGAVNFPGSYSFGPQDSIAGLIEASGGPRSDADLSAVKLYIPSSTADPDTQKIDINRASLWLLKALPGIGEARAQAVLDYRDQNGRFKNIEEITLVPGINSALYDTIKELITTDGSEEN